MKSKKIVLTVLAVTVLFTAVAFCLGYGGRWYGSGTGQTVPPVPSPDAKFIFPFHEWKADVIDNEFLGGWLDEKHGDYGWVRGKVKSTPNKSIMLAEGKWTWIDTKGKEITVGTFEIYLNNKTWKCEGKWLNSHNGDSGAIKGVRTE